MVIWDWGNDSGWLFRPFGSLNSKGVEMFCKETHNQTDVIISLGHVYCVAVDALRCRCG